jgi:superoxide dismutase, Cu-Zn family
MQPIESILVAAMAAQTVLFSTISIAPSSARPFHANASPFFAQAAVVGSPSVSSLKLVAKRAPVVAAALKKAVAVLKGTSEVGGVVTLTQEDDGLFFPLLEFYLMDLFDFGTRGSELLMRCLISVVYC